MRRRARPGSTRVACMPTAFLAGAVLLTSAGLACAPRERHRVALGGVQIQRVHQRRCGRRSARRFAGRAAQRQCTAEHRRALTHQHAPAPGRPGHRPGPGHNGANWSHPAIINRLVNVISEWKPCDTAGAETDAGYAEHAFTFDVAMRLDRLLRAEGATVVLTRHNDHGVGPCVTQRAEIGNRAHADAAISIHADGGPPTGRGFEVIAPGLVRRAPTPRSSARRDRLALDIRNAYHRMTREPYSDYVGRRASTSAPTSAG